MTTPLHTKIAKTLAPAVVIAAIVAPGALAGSSKGTHVTIPASLANIREPGSTGYVPEITRVTIPAALANLREPGSTGYVPTTALVQSRGGFDWVSALIGAAGALGLAVAAAGSVMTMRKRRPVAHV